MQKPRRGEVWLFSFPDAFPGEMGVEFDQEGFAKIERPCVIVSHDAFNNIYDRYNIASLTTRDGRVGTPGFDIGIMSNWSVLIKKSNRNGLRDDSLVDCGQLWTAPLFSRSSRIGELTKTEMAEVDKKLLSVLTGKGIRKTGRRPPFQDWAVIEAEFINADGSLSREWLLVVSSREIDAIRPLKHCTVVRLMPMEMFVSSNPHAVVLVDISRGSQGEYETKLAVCPEILALRQV